MHTHTHTHTHRNTHTHTHTQAHTHTHRNTHTPLTPPLTNHECNPAPARLTASRSNAWKDGFPDAPSSQNNITASRRAAGVQAWHEWLPVRPSGGVGSASSYTELAINRTLNFGSTLSLFLTEDRLQGRSVAVR